ncbi:MAG: condensation domain-containing protein, partial [Usitatibacteraceae bacterium]
MNLKNSSDAQLAAVEYDPFAGGGVSRVVPTTEAQREIWLADRLGREASLAFNESISLRFSGPLDEVALAQALTGLVERHEALRGEELCIGEPLNITPTFVDLSDLDSTLQDKAVCDVCTRAVETQFDLENGPLFRAELLRTGVEQHVLIITAHHIICDGWSFGILINDLAKLYAQGKGLLNLPLDVPSVFSDFAVEQRALENGPMRAADENWWVSRFAGELPILDLPLDRARPAWRTFRSRRLDITFDAGLLSDARRLGAKSGAGLFGTMLAGFAVALHRLTRGSDIIVGIPAAGQSIGGHENLVGHCVNLLPIRLEVEPNSEMQSVIGKAQSALLDAYEHQSYTFGS